MIGADECAENLKKTYELFPNGIVPDDYMERSDAISELSGFDGWDEEELFDDEEEFEEEVYPFEEFDEFYIKERDEVIEKIYDYIIKHASEFVIKG